MHGSVRVLVWVLKRWSLEKSRFLDWLERHRFRPNLNPEHGNTVLDAYSRDTKFACRSDPAREVHVQDQERCSLISR